MQSVRSFFMVCALLCMYGNRPLFAATDHTTLVKGPFKTGEQVTSACLQCHQKQANDFIKTTHWNWKGHPQPSQGDGKEQRTVR